jgi:hypothetical protein
MYSHQSSESSSLVCNILSNHIGLAIPRAPPTLPDGSIFPWSESERLKRQIACSFCPSRRAPHFSRNLALVHHAFDGTSDVYAHHSTTGSRSSLRAEDRYANSPGQIGRIRKCDHFDDFARQDSSTCDTGTLTSTAISVCPPAPTRPSAVFRPAVSPPQALLVAAARQRPPRAR